MALVDDDCGDASPCSSLVENRHEIERQHADHCVILRCDETSRSFVGAEIFKCCMNLGAGADA